MSTQVQNVKINIIRITRFLFTLLCYVSAIFSGFAFFDALQVRNIESADNEQFGRIAKSANLKYRSANELEAIAQKAVSLSPPLLELAEEANHLLMTMTENCLNCENRIVFLDQYEDGRLDDTGLKSLERSFDLSPYGKESMMKWRLEIAAHHWDDLSPELRKAALRQITALAQRKVDRQWLTYQFKTDVSQIQDRISRLHEL